MNKKWIKAALIRALKTFCQTIISMVTIGACVSEIDVKYVASCSVVAAVLSICTSIVGLPEVEENEE